MTVKLKAAMPRGASRRWRGAGAWLAQPYARVIAAVVIFAGTALVGAFAYTWAKYEGMVERRMHGQIFASTAKIYAAPQQLHPGDPFDRAALVAELRRAGYSQDALDDQKIGDYKLLRHGIEIEPGPNSYHSPEGALITAENGKIVRIAALSDGRGLGAYELEPELITALFEGGQRAKRRLVRYSDIPKELVDAVLAIEDRRFFQHGGINYYRVMEAAWVDLLAGRPEEGASTITMQVARGFFLSPEKTLRRKAEEALISTILEQKFTKTQIFEMYTNEVYMGQRGSFTISGMGEAAEAYFGKDVKNLTLPEAALLAGMIQRPNYYSPYKYPERALDRRNRVLDAMVETGAITHDQAEQAQAVPLKLAPPNEEASEAPYFVDLVKEQLFGKYSEAEVNDNAYRIYTTLDPNLQRAAALAVESGLKDVDAEVNKLRTRRVRAGKGKSAKWVTQVTPGPLPQVALVALNPHSGAVLALVGGRNYGQSQLDHAVARRPTGSIFKPLVYAAAMSTAVNGSQPVFTPVTMLNDEPTTFTNGDQIYEPRNYEEKYMGPVTARYALALSLNNATVLMAQEAGYDRVAALAKAAGITSVEATPAMALGSYDATPIDMAGAYTIFANGGSRIAPIMIASLRDADGDVIENFHTTTQPVLDPRVAYVMTSMMEGVLNFGTAEGVRARGFTAPAAGKTGSSHDAWFAGYTSQLLCIVWVGYDDYSDIRLSGALAAAPIWGDFMKRAVTIPGYSNPQPFTPPPGVDEVKLDKVTNLLATSTCPDDYDAAFIAGTEPTQSCNQPGGLKGFFTKILGLNPKPFTPPPVSNGQPPPAAPPAPAAGQVPQPAKKKPGFWGRIFGGGSDNKGTPSGQNPSPNQGPQPH